MGKTILGGAMEIRTAKLGAVQLRASTTGGPGTLSGYAAVFNKLSQNLGGFVEVVAPGAFTKTLADQVPVMCRYNHDDNFLLGTTEAATLRLLEDGTGLFYEDDLPDTTAGVDVGKLAERSDLRYSSFAFYVLDDDWGLTDQGFPLRTLKAVQLVDVAPVNNPAYRDTTTGVRSLAQRIGVDTIAGLTTEQIRERLSKPPDDGSPDAGNGQADSHPDRDQATRRLQLLKLQR